MSRTALCAAALAALAVTAPRLAWAQEETAEDEAPAADAAEDDAAEAPPDEVAAGEPDLSPTAVAAEQADDEAGDEGGAAEAEEEGDLQAYAAQLRQRQELGSIHRAFGIATWGAMLVTAVLGAIQFHNLYGGFGGREDTPCVQGNAVFGQDQCWGIPWPHRIAALSTSALYATTFTLSFLLPDPDHLSEGRGAFAERLNIHKALRWVHLAGMVAQIFLGFATAQNWFGIDRANDFETQRVLASVHQGIGWATFGVLTAAGAIMIF